MVIMADFNYEIRTFGGHEVDKHPRIIKPGGSPDCQNIRVDSLLGALKNDVGIVKTVTEPYADDIVGIHQLEDMDRYGLVDVAAGTPLGPRIIGEFGTDPSLGQMTDPWGIEVYGDELYVGDFLKNIIVFSLSGTVKRYWSVSSAVTGIGSWTNSKIYVPSPAIFRLEQYDTVGTLEATYGTDGSGDGAFTLGPYDAMVSGSEIYIADSGNDRVQVFDLSGVYVRKWGTGGTGNGQFDRPRGIFVYNSEVYVSDVFNDRIQVFDTNGVYQRQWGTFGTGNGQFNRPYDIEVYEDEVYVADSQNHRIQVFTTAGVYVREFGSFGGGGAGVLGDFNLPIGIVVYNDEVYITDKQHNQIQVLGTDGSGY
jgi:hypothetical protein